jgi:hypothetical protein
VSPEDIGTLSPAWRILVDDGGKMLTDAGQKSAQSTQWRSAAFTLI